MTDKFSVETRSRIMSLIKGKDTKPEILVRKALHSFGFRYRVHSRKLPGQPDIVLPKYKAVVMVNGCFWHGHDCHIYRPPQSQSGFWLNKINKNKTRDQKNESLLHEAGWRIAIVWECALSGKTRLNFESFIDELSYWIRSDKKDINFMGIQK